LPVAAPTSDPTQLVLAIEGIAARIAEANLPAVLLDAHVARFGLTKPIVKLIEAHSIPSLTTTVTRSNVSFSALLQLQ
jgi:TPP-dependent 2-oxoacid decarboxylase